MTALLANATVELGKPYGKIELLELTIGGDKRRSLFMHPKSRATFPPTRLTLDSRLEVSVGINEAAWDQAGDGVEFSVYARPVGGEEVRLFSTYIDPKHESRDRRWVDGVVTLGVYSGQDVSLVLETGPGPKEDLGWDWAGWSRAQLFVGGE